MWPWEGARQTCFMSVNLWIWILSGIYVTHEWQRGKRESGQEGLPGCWSHFLGAHGLCSEAPEKGEKHEITDTQEIFGMHLVNSDDIHGLGNTWTARTERGDTSLPCLSWLSLAFLFPVSPPWPRASSPQHHFWTLPISTFLAYTYVYATSLLTQFLELSECNHTL